MPKSPLSAFDLRNLFTPLFFLHFCSVWCFCSVCCFSLSFVIHFFAPWQMDFLGMISASWLAERSRPTQSRGYSPAPRTADAKATYPPSKRVMRVRFPCRAPCRSRSGLQTQHRVPLFLSADCTSADSYAVVAQSAERLICNQRVAGSSPADGSIFRKEECYV